MSELSIPLSTMQNLEIIPYRSNATLLLRHSHRLPLTNCPPSYGSGVGLTSEGVRTAEELGIILRQFQPGLLQTSLVLRCVNTLEAIEGNRMVKNIVCRITWFIRILADPRCGIVEASILFFPPHPHSIFELTIMTLFPDLSDMLIKQVHVAHELTFTMPAIALTASCPSCGTISKRIQSRYIRTLCDLPSGGRLVHLVVHVRRFFCCKRTCSQKFFSSSFPFWHSLVFNAPNACKRLFVTSALRWEVKQEHA